MQRYESHQADAQVNLPHRVTLQSVRHTGLAGQTLLLPVLRKRPAEEKGSGS